MLYRTKKREGRAVQYRGNNLLELRETFPSLTFNYLRSTTRWDRTDYSDLRVVSSKGDADLIAGDWLIEDGDSWFVVPMCEFEEYWEKA